MKERKYLGIDNEIGLRNIKKVKIEQRSIVKLNEELSNEEYQLQK